MNCFFIAQSRTPNPICGRLAQLAEHLTLNQGVLGSSPRSSTNQIRNRLQSVRLRILLFFTKDGFLPFAHIFAHKLVGRLHFAALCLSLQTPLQEIHSSLSGRLSNMSVGVQCYPYIRMAHQHLQVFEIRSARHHIRSIGVPQPMHVERYSL